MKATTTKTVTQAQIDRCHRILDEKTGKVFYQVESQTTAGVEYEVRYIKNGAFSCTCPATVTCWHIRASLAHAQEFKQLARIATLESLGLTHAEACKAVESKAIINGKPATDEELVRIFQTVARPTEAQINADYEQYQSRAFSLMR